MAADAKQGPALFDPTAFQSFVFRSCELGAHGEIALTYALDDQISFTERIALPLAVPLDDAARQRTAGLLALLHWVAGVSYYKTALPPAVRFDAAAPGPAAAALLRALYSEGLAELAYVNDLAELPRPSFGDAVAAGHPSPAPPSDPRRVLVPVGGGKDSIVALEIVRRAGVEAALFSVGDPGPIARTVAVAGLPRLLARRRLDPELLRLNRSGAINGHVPITAIVACIALLTAALNGYDSVALANERSASSPNFRWRGIEVNHQFSKGLRAERLLRAAAAEAGGGVELFSLLRPASELAIARAFARMTDYHGAFTSCNAVFRGDPARRTESWCCECPKCRFVFLALAPFSEPEHLRAIFGRDLLDEDGQYEGFALLAASGGHKPLECVGEEVESVAAMRLLAADERWRSHRVVARLADEVLAGTQATAGDPAEVLALSAEHDVPASLIDHVHALLGA